MAIMAMSKVSVFRFQVSVFGFEAILTPET